MPLPELDPDGVINFAISGAESPVELVLDYCDPTTGANAMAKPPIPKPASAAAAAGTTA